ncbi:glutathione S-transferase N-terminal domain-containing protein [bacterium]|nr:glutathione S-transferase N-terminal domain-containing protein [bacterium]
MIEIFGKPMCPFCDQAKALCESRGLKYTYKSLGTDYTKEELLEAFPGARTVPQIRINGTAIGGFDKLGPYLEETGYTGTGHTL